MRMGRDVPRPRRLNDFLNDRRPRLIGRFENLRFDLNLGMISEPYIDIFRCLSGGALAASCGYDIPDLSG